MYKYLSRELKQEILRKVKEEGAKVPETARQYGISEKTVYKWLKNGITADNSSLEISRLQRKIKELQEIIGELVADQKLVKKKRDIKNGQICKS